MVYRHHFRLNINGLESRYILMAIQIHSYCMIPIVFGTYFALNSLPWSMPVDTDHKMFLTSKLERQ
jgi:hypothetical protein